MYPPFCVVAELFVLLGECTVTATYMVETWKYVKVVLAGGEIGLSGRSDQQRLLSSLPLVN